MVLLSSSHGHYITTGKINNEKTIFLVDTKASSVSVLESVASKVGLKKVFLLVSTVNEKAIVYSTNMHKISIGNIKLQDIKADINPKMDSDEILLGMSFLRYLSVLTKATK